MLLAFALLSLPQIAPPVKWYGPATVTFNVQVPGNPYDPDENDLRVRFIPDRGPTEERIAWVDLDGTINATLVASNQTRYRAVLLRNGKQMVSEPEGGFVDLKLKLPKGYIRRDPDHKNRIRWDNGDPYYPLGFNLGWQSADILPMREQIAKMSANGANWTRIWANHWDNKNPWWPIGDMPAEKGELWPKALLIWEDLEKTCDQMNVPFQMVLFHHGAFSTTVNPNWQDHPWNVAQGGFLKDAADFFTDKEAKRRAKMWLRYAVARYAHSPNLMAWELFNEVEWVDATKARWGDIEAWHKEMAEYIRSIDPYHHLITTSSAMDRPKLWESMDYYQPHTYPSNVTAAIAGSKILDDKPYFFGEFGPPDDSESALAAGVRDGIYGAMLSNHAGAAQYWTWDLVEKRNLYPIYKTAAAVLSASDLPSHPNAKPYQVQISTPGSAPLVFGPGRGWGRAEKTTFDLPQDANPSSLAKLPSFLQGQTGGNKGLFPEPLVFRFTATKPGTFRMSVNQVAKGGAQITVLVNDVELAKETWPPADQDTKVSTRISVPFATGTNTIRIENRGADWANVRSFEFSDLAPQATAMALGESDWLMLRLVASDDALPAASLGALPIGDGDYELTTINLQTGEQAKSTVTIERAALKDFKMSAPDIMLIFARKR
jgi:hypothetical protein